jgi:hypothetical protein
MKVIVLAESTHMAAVARIENGEISKIIFSLSSISRSN